MATWADIPAAQKDAGGLWYSDYGGYVSIGCNAAKVGGTCPTTIKALDNPAYKGDVALNGDPTSANAAFEAVWAAALANGGSADNIQPGIDFFSKLNKEGIFNKTKVTPATVASGETPIVLDWDYLNVGNAGALKKPGRHLDDARPVRRSGLRLLRPGDQHQRRAPGRGAAVGGVPLQPGHRRRPERLAPRVRPADRAAGDDHRRHRGQDGAGRCCRQVTDPNPFNPTQAQVTAAKAVVTQKWAAAVS